MRVGNFGVRREKKPKSWETGNLRRAEAKRGRWHTTQQETQGSTDRPGERKERKRQASVREV